MKDNMKDLENTNLTDDQTEEVAGGFPGVSRPIPRNAKLEDEQTEQVSGGRRRPRAIKDELAEDKLDQVSGGKLPFPVRIAKQNNALTDEQTEQVSGGKFRANQSKSLKDDLIHQSQNDDPYAPTHYTYYG